MRRGPRKRLFESDYLRSRVWYWAVKEASGLPTAAAIERAISPKNFRPRESASGGFVYPGYFSKIRRGMKSPGKKLVTRTEKIFPGTKYWFYHPFWDVIRCPSAPAGVRLFFSDSLKSKYANALFNPPKDLDRHINPEAASAAYLEDTFQGLSTSSDLDSLTAAIWFMRRAKDDELYGKEVADYFSALILRIYTKVAAAAPFWEASTEVFEYINRYFIDLSEDHYWAEVIASGRMKIHIGYNRMVLNFINDLGILRKHKRAPAACLQVITHHITPAFFGKIADLETETDMDKIKALPEIKSLTDDLRSWEDAIRHND